MKKKHAEIDKKLSCRQGIKVNTYKYNVLPIELYVFYELFIILKKNKIVLFGLCILKVSGFLLLFKYWYYFRKLKRSEFNKPITNVIEEANSLLTANSLFKAFCNSHYQILQLITYVTLKKSFNHHHHHHRAMLYQ